MSGTLKRTGHGHYRLVTSYKRFELKNSLSFPLPHIPPFSQVIRFSPQVSTWEHSMLLDLMGGQVAVSLSAPSCIHCFLFVLSCHKLAFKRKRCESSCICLRLPRHVRIPPSPFSSPQKQFKTILSFSFILRSLTFRKIKSTRRARPHSFHYLPYKGENNSLFNFHLYLIFVVNTSLTIRNRRTCVWLIKSWTHARSLLKDAKSIKVFVSASS